MIYEFDAHDLTPSQAHETAVQWARRGAHKSDGLTVRGWALSPVERAKLQDMKSSAAGPKNDKTQVEDMLAYQQWIATIEAAGSNDSLPVVSVSSAATLGAGAVEILDSEPFFPALQHVELAYQNHRHESYQPHEPFVRVRPAESESVDPFDTSATLPIDSCVGDPQFELAYSLQAPPIEETQPVRSDAPAEPTVSARRGAVTQMVDALGAPTSMKATAARLSVAFFASLGVVYSIMNFI